MAEPLGLYVHVPFCQRKCFYCDFNTYAGIEALLPSYIRALAAEVRRWGLALPERGRLKTLFFGGGTPSLLSPQQLEVILRSIHDAFDLEAEFEFTVEANPESVTSEKMRAFRSLGVNRVSLGMQSFQAQELELLGRLHDARRAVEAFQEVRAAGVENVNVDLMYGLPHQTLEGWRDTLRHALALGSEHLSLYALTLEERTPFFQWAQEGKIPTPDPDLAADMYEEASATLERAGYFHYEISNWARPGRESRHNLIYWRNGPFLGVGPGAHSFLCHTRFSTLLSPRHYVETMARLEAEGPPPRLTSLEMDTLPLELLRRIAPAEAVDPINPALERAETLILGLRLGEGISDDQYRKRTGLGLFDLYEQEIATGMEAGLLELEQTTLRLTPRGRLLANEVFVRLLPS